MISDPPITSEERAERLHTDPAMSLGAQCREARPKKARVDTWTDYAVMDARALGIAEGISERNIDTVMINLAADGRAISPRAIQRKEFRERATAHSRPSRASGEALVLGPHCGVCDPFDRTKEDANGALYKCSDCNPLAIQKVAA